MTDGYDDICLHPKHLTYFSGCYFGFFSDAVKMQNMETQKKGDLNALSRFGYFNAVVLFICSFFVIGSERVVRVILRSLQIVKHYTTLVFILSYVPPSQGCQMVYFQTKPPIK
jgi:hypothetical protein